jgi:hypothetical protein
VPPVHDLGLIDDEAVILHRSQAWDMPHRAFDILKPTARPTHDVVMIVTDP